MRLQVTELRESSQMGAALKKRRIVQVMDKADQKQVSLHWQLLRHNEFWASKGL